ncbi:hypothetical protein AGMMS50256_09540 [Betaproteobacteria bacterium]|nr:hypothetical protein AGMMS50256_09540 [Betaproteobacteria bacterium]
MIIFDLTCQHGHRFEGWFQSADAFDAQLARKLVSCPNCGSGEIRRVPSAVHLARAPEPAPPPSPSPSPANAAVVNPQSELLNAYRKLVTAAIANSEDVGTEFANEARKIHYLEAPERSIRGQASDKEFEALRDEGIEVLRLAVLNKEDLN